MKKVKSILVSERKGKQTFHRLCVDRISTSIPDGKDMKKIMRVSELAIDHLAPNVLSIDDQALLVLFVINSH